MSRTITTHTGQEFRVLRPDPALIRIEDIAHGLARKFRYSGQRGDYTVAEHSLVVSRLVPPEDALWGLFHDAGEAYTADIPSPLKPLLYFHVRRRDQWTLVSFAAVEARILRAVAVSLGLPRTIPPTVHAADLAARADEKAAISRGPARARPLSPDLAEKLFLARYREILTSHA